MNLQAKIDRIKNNLDAQAYTVAAGEAVKIIEIAFRKLLVDGLALLSDKDRLKVMQAIIEIGKGEKGVESFGLGQMLAVLRKSKFNDAWEAATSSDLSAIKMINLDALNEIRIKLTHDATEASKFEAEFLFHALEGVIQAFGIMSLEKQEPVASKAPASALEESKQENPIKGLAKKASSKQEASSYAPTDLNEAKRLSIQGGYSLDVDMAAFKHALRILPNDKDLVALDLGCARGNITKSRFGSFSVFKKVIGIDVNEKTIQIAQDKEGDEVFEFHRVNIESHDAEGVLNSILESSGVEGFDVIYSALTLHHLGNPLGALRKLRKLLNKGGVIILRGSDDETKIAYPDEDNLVSDIVRETCLLPTVSDRLNGRKLYHQLWKSGYRDIELFNKTTDTAGMDIDERIGLFMQSFSYRKNYLARLVEQYPDEPKWQEKLEWMQEALEALEIEFESEDFYYMELTNVAVGQKK